MARPEKHADKRKAAKTINPSLGQKGRFKTATGSTMMALEPRILLDAALADTASKIADAAAHHGDGTAHAPTPQVDKDIFKALAPMSRDGQGTEHTRREVVFVEADTANLKELLGKATPNRQVVVLSPNRDGVVQMTRVLSRMQQVDAVHIFSHGEGGKIKLGKGELSTENMQKYQKHLKAWAAHMTNAADILVYGCNVAEGARGADFVRMLAELTQA
ncbi:MAG: DUF4347 domain-containing protein, partial [Mariprofundaceae bacterium]|nr:DUF4347 domain-containing protein [Mariprofundaceae bacterium]